MFFAPKKNSIVRKNEKGKQYHPYNIWVVGKNIKWGRGEGDGNFEKKMKIKSGVGEEYQVVWNFIQP